MAEQDLSGSDGDVTFPTGIGGEARAFTIDRDMDTKQINRFASGSRMKLFRGGLIGVTGDIITFLRKGAANTSPDIVSPDPDGADLTLTISTGCTLVGNAIFPGLSIGVDHADPALEATHRYMYSDADLAETWAVS
jgi:hypothetical protein